MINHDFLIAKQIHIFGSVDKVIQEDKVIRNVSICRVTKFNCSNAITFRIRVSVSSYNSKGGISNSPFVILNFMSCKQLLELTLNFTLASCSCAAEYKSLTFWVLVWLSGGHLSWGSWKVLIRGVRGVVRCSFGLFLALYFAVWFI